MQFSKTIMLTFTQLELFSHSLKSMKGTSVSSLVAQSRELNITEPLWSYLETRVRKSFPPATSLKQLENVLQEKWYKIPLETVQNLYESIPRRSAPVLKAKYGPAPY
jgi:hypothetical protein